MKDIYQNVNNSLKTQPRYKMKNNQIDHIPDISKMVSTEDISTEFVEIVNKNFWEMIDMENNQIDHIPDVVGKTIKSVDMYEQELNNLLFKYSRGKLGYTQLIMGKSRLYQQAKEMHKQEIMDAYEEGYKDAEDTLRLNPEQYYNETFK